MADVFIVCPIAGLAQSKFPSSLASKQRDREIAGEVKGTKEVTLDHSN